MNLDETLSKFISRTAKSKVAVIIPLFGYWKDVANNPLNLQTLKLTMDRVNSSVHNLYVFFVAEPNRIPTNIQNYIITKTQAGNCSGVPIHPSKSSYAEYVREGLRVAQETTDSAYFVVINPWNLIQKSGIDIMVDRLNYSDTAKIVCGTDLHKKITLNQFDPEEFERIFYDIPHEQRETDFNFMGMTRYALEMVSLDQNIKTKIFLERDMWQTLLSKGYDAITTERLPMFVFDVSMQEIEKREDIELDREYFIKKWGFNPEI